MASLATGVTRSFFRLCETFAPDLGGHAAFRLFSRTADARKPSARERQAIKRFAPIMEDARRHRLKVGKGCVVAHVFKPLAGAGTGRTALVVHGWNSRSDHMVPIIMQLRAGGYRVVALDLPGHGRSDGRHSNMALAVAACCEADLWFGPFDAVVGHSFGGAVALNAMAGSVRPLRPVAAGRLVMISAPNAIGAVFDQFAGYLRLGKRIQAALANRVERLTGTPLRDFVGARQLARLAVPTLVVHAPEDREVGAESARAMAAAGGHVALEWIPEAGHRRILSDARTLNAIGDFLCGGDVRQIRQLLAKGVSTFG